MGIEEFNLVSFSRGNRFEESNVPCPECLKHGRTLNMKIDKMSDPIEYVCLRCHCTVVKGDKKE